MSIRAACGAIGFDRSMFHYKSRRTDQAAVAKRIRSAKHVSGMATDVCTSCRTAKAGESTSKESIILQGVGDAAEAQDTEAAREGEAAR